MNGEMEYLIYLDGEQVGHYVDGNPALWAAWRLKQDNHDLPVAIAVVTVEEVSLSDRDWEARGAATSPVEHAALVADETRRGKPYNQDAPDRIRTRELRLA